jgi:uncharacterized protein
MQKPFVWHDLMTTDVEAAKSFYGKVVGWEFGLQPPDYHLLQVKGLGIGGIMAQPDHLKGMPPFWSGYIHVPDMDAACARLTSLGGSIKREPWDIPGMLRMAVVADRADVLSHAATDDGQHGNTSARQCWHHWLE